MVPRVDFDIVDSILRVLDGWELGNKGLYRKYWSYKNIIKISKFDFGPGSPKNRFLRFSMIFYEKNPEIRKSWPALLESRVRRPGNLEAMP